MVAAGRIAHRAGGAVLHGNDSTLHTDIDLILSLRRLGLAVMAIDYRGYGDGAWYLPSQHSVYADARVAWQAFKQRSPEASKHLVYGHSWAEPSRWTWPRCRWAWTE